MYVYSSAVLSRHRLISASELLSTDSTMLFTSGMHSRVSTALPIRAFENKEVIAALERFRTNVAFCSSEAIDLRDARTGSGVTGSGGTSSPCDVSIQQSAAPDS